MWTFRSTARKPRGRRWRRCVGRRGLRRRLAVGVLVAAVAALHDGGAAEFAGPQNERGVEEAALF